MKELYGNQSRPYAFPSRLGMDSTFAVSRHRTTLALLPQVSRGQRGWRESQGYMETTCWCDVPFLLLKQD